MEKTNSSRLKRAAITNLLLLLLVIFLINFLGTFKFLRFDLTSEKRYTLSPTTISLLENLDDYVFVKVYLEGDFPAEYKKLRNSTREMLDEFRAYSDLVHYEFINPSESEDEAERKAIYKQLYREGLTYTTPVEQKSSGVSQTLIWPGALFTYKGRTLPLQLLKSSTYANEVAMINRSVNDLEYEMTNTIRKLRNNSKPKIAIIEGHGEIDSLETKDFTDGLREYYTVERIRIDSNLTSLVYHAEKKDSFVFAPRYQAIIIAGPDSAYSEKDKFVVDQYIMHGGKVLWLTERVSASMDSLSSASAMMAYPLDLNLDDQLFKYGARINSDLVMDLRSSVIPVVVGMVGNQPRYEPKRWPYFPLSLPTSNHPVVNNLNAIKFDFASSIDTVAAAGIRKTVLLAGSERGTVINAPARISLNILREEPDLAVYSKSGIPLAVLLEGKFSSVFGNRVVPEIKDNKAIGFLNKCEKDNAMIVIGDADVVRNRVNRKEGKLSPLGYDRFTGETYGNKDFLLNCVNYLCDDSGLISVRSREARLRLLDETKIKENRAAIQLRNVSLPILVILILGLILTFIRRRKYGRAPIKNEK